MRYKVGLTLSWLLTLIFLLTPAANADSNGRIRGTVVDAQNALVAGATVKIINIDTGYERTVTAGETGGFDVPALPPGKYAVTISKEGFRTYKQTDINLQAAQVLEVSATLEVGAVSQTVEVGAAKLQADTTTIQLGGELAAGDIKDYPLLNRAWINLQTTLPGVVASSDRFGNNFSTNGSRTQSNNYLVNGTDSNDLPLNTANAAALNPDAIQEVKVVDSTLNPEYGRNSGATMVVNTKYGTNDWHGSAFEFYRDTFLNSKNFFSNTVPPFHQNQFGGSFGGHILRNKLFGFFAYQGTRSFNGVANSASVFTSAQRGGSFGSALATSSSTSPIPLFGNSASTCPVSVGVRCPAGTTYSALFGGTNPDRGAIPTQDFNSVSANLLANFIPSANDPTGSLFLFSNNTTTGPNQYIYRVDYNPSNKDSVFFYNYINRAHAVNTLPFLPGLPTGLPGFGQFSQANTYQYTVSETHVFNSSMLNEFKVGYNRLNFDAVEPTNIVSPASLGFTGITPQNTASQSAPTVSVTGLFTFGFSNNGPQPRIDEVTQLLDNFSYTTGKHAYKWGTDIRRGQVSNPFFFQNNGAFSFGGGGTFSTGVPGADFLLGFPDSYGQSSGSLIKARAWEYYFYIQDQWKIRSNLTFTYGIGWQIDTPLTDLFNNGVAINAFRPSPPQQSTVFPTAPAGLVFPGDAGISSSGYRTHYNNFAPRLGFAWNVMRKLTLRAGWGIYYNNSEEELTLQNLLAPPFALISSGASDFPLFGSPSFATPYAAVNGGSIPNKFPFSPPAAGSAVDFPNLFEPFGLNVLDPRLNTQAAYNFNLTAQYQVTPTILTTFSYVGSLGRRLEGVVEQNPYNKSVCLATPGCRGARAVEFSFPSVGTTADASVFASVGQQGTFLNSNYNSFQGTVEKALSHGLSLRAAYTYSHALDNGSSFEAGNIIPGNPRLTYGNSQFDARQRLAFEYRYQIPDWGLGYLGRLPKRITTGWTFSGVTSLQTGFPIPLTESDFRTLQCTPVASFYGCWDRPNVVAPVQIFSDPRGVQTLPGSTGPNRTGNFYFSPASFAREGCTSPTQPIATCGFGLGNSGRNFLHGPGINNSDLSFYKNTNIRESLKLQLRVDLFNAFNHAQFNNPSGSVTSSLFGRVTTTRIPARITQLSVSLSF